MRDMKTIDAHTLLQFSSYEAQEKWLKMIKDNYFNDDFISKCMDFARRWAKSMQYQMKRQGKTLEDSVLDAAIEANIDNITVEHLDTAISYVSEIWKYGDTFQKWVDNGGYDTIKALF